MAFGRRKLGSLAGAPGRLTANCTLIAFLTLASLFAATGISSAATTFNTLYQFQQDGDGTNPEAGPVFDPSGNLYGTTTGGGAYGGNGTVFKLTAPTAKGGAWTESVLHSFTGGSDGGYPFAGLIAGASGVLYGTTIYGGTHFNGTVFKLTPSGSETVLYRFTGASDGERPSARLIADASGNLYGTTVFGGAYGWGTVFELTPSGSESVLHSFTGGSDGAEPQAGLIADASGNLYGTTLIGGGSGCGGYGCGAVFKLTPSGTETVLHGFTGGSDGATPETGLIADASGNLYGATFQGGDLNCGVKNSGCGTVFKLTPSGSETVLHTFTGGSDGALPFADLIFDAAGALYGATGYGGNLTGCAPDPGCGVVFKLTAPKVTGGAWTETVLYTFTGGSDGSGPSGVIFEQRATSMAPGTLAVSAGAWDAARCSS